MVKGENFRNIINKNTSSVLSKIDIQLQAILPPEPYEKLKNAYNESRENIKDVATSGAIQETSNFAAMFVQAGIGLALLVPLQIIPPEYHKLIILDALVLAYAVGPLLQVEALKQTGKTNSIIAAGVNKGVEAVFHNPDIAAWSGIVVATSVGWTLDQLRNPVNGAALAFSMIRPDLPIASADLLSVIAAGSIATVSSNLLLLKNSH